MLKRFVQLAFEFEYVAETADSTGTFRIDLDSFRILDEGFFDLCVCFKEVSFDLVSSFVIWVHAENFVTDLQAIVVATHFAL